MGCEMKIIIKSKKNKHPVGVITSGIIRDNLQLKVSYQANEKFVLDLQRFLLEYYDLDILSPKEIKSRFILPELKRKHKIKLREIGFVRNYGRKLKKKKQETMH